MNQILVGTDFSEHSLRALEYAVQFSQKHGSRIAIVHSFVAIPAIGIDGGPDQMNKTIIDEGMKNSQEKLETLRNDILLKTKASVEVTIHVKAGDPAFQLCDYASECQADLIVLGSVGESKLEKLLFGSTTLEVMRHAPCPVLSIPVDAVYKSFSKILCATGLEDNDLKLILESTKWAKKYNADVVVFHAFEEDTILDQSEADDFVQMIKRSVDYPKIRTESTTYVHSKEAILSEVMKTNADLLVMRERSRGIFNRLFHPDHVKHINEHVHIPLLIMNDKILG